MGLLTVPVLPAQQAVENAPRVNVPVRERYPCTSGSSRVEI